MKKVKIDWLGIFVVMFIACTVIVGYTDRTLVPDLRYLYNRAEQMLQCIQDGRIPFFYYNDFGGAGYGSSFFYGQLTLYPFLPFVKLGISQFLNAYTIASIALTYTGSCYLCKRFSRNYKFISILFMCSCFIIQSFFSFSTLSNLLATGISFYFIGSCVDFFRDNKSFIPASIFFYLLMGTHLVTSVISFIICIMLFIMYFDKKRLKDYIKFACFTCVICAYFIANIIYHWGVVTNTKAINTRMLSYVAEGNGNIITNYQSKLPFTGVLFNIIIDKFGYNSNDGFHLINLAVIILLIIWGRHKFSKREISVFIIDLICTVLSVRLVWVALNKLWLNPIQFPCRFSAYIVLSIMLIFLRNIDLTKLKKRVFIVCCLPELLLVSFVTTPLDSSLLTDNTYTYQVINGEYLDKSFDWDLTKFEYKKSHVTDQYGNEYKYDIYKDKVVISVVNRYDDLELTFPKLYYKGYTLCKVDREDSFAMMNDEKYYESTYLQDITDKYDVEMGDSQFIKVSLGGSSGTFVLKYQHPVWLIVLDIVGLLTVIISLIDLIIIRKSSKES